MRTISEQELKDILDKHGEWLKDSSKGCRANLSSANLSYADLSYADLSSANLSSANLRYADLSYADLRYADLRSANLVVFQFQMSWAYFTFDGTLRIGCESMLITEWVLGYQEIGKRHGYSELQIMMYGNFIKSCMELFEKLPKDSK
jgi:hypothetical protein